jgi:hypothetical protein
MLAAFTFEASRSDGTVYRVRVSIGLVPRWLLSFTVL